MAESAETVESLFEKLMGSDNPLEQIQAAYALGNHPSRKKTLNFLIKGLVIPDADVKLTILDILLQPDFFGEKIVLPVSNLLKDEDSEVRKHAAELLGATKDKRIVASLINTLNDEDLEVRQTVMSALANIGDATSSIALEPFIDSENWEDRFNAIDAIGMLANKDSVPIFLRAFNDPHPKVRENAVLSVGHFNYPQIVERLLFLLEDDAIEVQAAAIYILGDFECKSAVKPLIDFCKSNYNDLVLISLESLSKIKDPESVPAIISVLNHPEREISTTAQETLDVFDNSDLIEPLVEAMKKDVIIEYIKHRIQKFPAPKGKRFNIRRYIRGLQLPIWMESLLDEIIISYKEEQEKPF